MRGVVGEVRERRALVTLASIPLQELSPSLNHENKMRLLGKVLSGRVTSSDSHSEGSLTDAQRLPE